VASESFNRALGGPARQPGDFFQDTECRKFWLAWVGQLVKRWQALPNICAWEVFSELDMATGGNEDAALELVRKAAAVVRSSDPRRRPVIASLSGVLEWPKLFSSDALDIIQAHPYANGSPRLKNQLDELIFETVRGRLKTYGKPVMIGESGLDWRPARPSRPSGVTASADGDSSRPLGGGGLRSDDWPDVVVGRRL